MKTPTTQVDLEFLQSVYNRTHVELEGSGYRIRKVSGCNHTRPNIVLHVPTMEIPFLHGHAINLFKEGLTGMDKVVEILHFDYEISGLLFVKNGHIENESVGGYSTYVYHATLADPEDSNALIVISAIADSSRKDGHYYKDEVEERLNEACIFERYSIPRCDGNRLGFLYQVLPIGFRNTGDEKQDREDFLITREEIIQLANDYLGIENDNPASQEQSSQEPALAATEHRFWLYLDDLSFERTYVIDSCGRVLAPDSFEDHRSRFAGNVEQAGYQIWQNIPEDALVVSWRKIGILGPHEPQIIQRPEQLTDAQFERCANIEKSVESRYKDCISPYNQQKSPDIGEGFGLWSHRPAKVQA